MVKWWRLLSCCILNNTFCIYQMFYHSTNSIPYSFNHWPALFHLVSEEEYFKGRVVYMFVCGRISQTVLLTAYTWAQLQQRGQYVMQFSKNIKVCLSPHPWYGITSVPLLLSIFSIRVCASLLLKGMRSTSVSDTVHFTVLCKI